MDKNDNSAFREAFEHFRTFSVGSKSAGETYLCDEIDRLGAEVGKRLGKHLILADKKHDAVVLALNRRLFNIYYESCNSKIEPYNPSEQFVTSPDCADWIPNEVS